MTNEKKIVIIGAGIAGISAAVHLYQKGFKNISILEARNRIGGRINTIDINGKILELGAQWITGGCASNNLFNLAQKLGLLGEKVLIDALSTDIPKHIHLPNGFPVRDDAKEIIVSLYDTLWIEIDHFYERSFLKNFPKYPTSIEDFYDKKTEELIAKLPEINSCVLEEVRQVMKGLKNCFAILIGDDLNLAQVDLFGSSHELPGGDVVVPRGLISILKTLLQSLPEEALRLNSIVKNICWNNENEILTYLVNNNEPIKSDYVICTFPIGVLKAHHSSLFTPSLPSDKTEAIENMGFGRLCKIFLEWASPWWSKHKLLFVSDSTTTEDSWTNGISTVDPVRGHPNLCVIWIAGKYAQMAEEVSDTTLLQDVSKIFRKYTGDVSLEEPRHVIRHFWNRDPFSLGTYSFPSLHSKAEDVAHLSAPLPHSMNPKLCFAGEATDEHYWSYMHGARSSGLREAERIINHCRVNNN